MELLNEYFTNLEARKNSSAEFKKKIGDLHKFAQNTLLTFGTPELFEDNDTRQKLHYLQTKETTLYFDQGEKVRRFRLTQHISGTPRGSSDESGTLWKATKGVEIQIFRDDDPLLGLTDGFSELFTIFDDEIFELDDETFENDKKVEPTEDGDRKVAVARALAEKIRLELAKR